MRFWRMPICSQSTQGKTSKKTYSSRRETRNLANQVKQSGHVSASNITKQANLSIGGAFSGKLVGQEVFKFTVSDGQVAENAVLIELLSLTKITRKHIRPPPIYIEVYMGWIMNV